MIMGDLKCKYCGFVHETELCARSSPRLPQPDAWDERTGLQELGMFRVGCEWIPINEEWAVLRPHIILHDGIYSLAKEVEVFRVYKHTSTGPVESPLLTAVAWTRKALASGGVRVLDMFMRTPGHLTDGVEGRQLFRWHATVGSKLSVAVVRLDGNLTGHARLVPVE